MNPYISSAPDNDELRLCRDRWWLGFIVVSVILIVVIAILSRAIWWSLNMDRYQRNPYIEVVHEIETKVEQALEKRDR